MWRMHTCLNSQLSHINIPLPSPSLSPSLTFTLLFALPLSLETPRRQWHPRVHMPMCPCGPKVSFSFFLFLVFSFTDVERFFQVLCSRATSMPPSPWPLQGVSVMAMGSAQHATLMWLPHHQVTPHTTKATSQAPCAPSLPTAALHAAPPHNQQRLKSPQRHATLRCTGKFVSTCPTPPLTTPPPGSACHQHLAMPLPPLPQASHSPPASLSCHIPIDT